MDTLGPALEARSIRLETTIDADVGLVVVDPDRVQQIVWNLLSNAIKFTPEGGTVRLSLARVDSTIEIAVSDSGVGIDPGFPAVRLRAVSSGRSRHAAAVRRSGARAGHRPPPGGAARRHRRAESAGEGRAPRSAWCCRCGRRGLTAATGAPLAALDAPRQRASTRRRACARRGRRSGRAGAVRVDSRGGRRRRCGRLRPRRRRWASWPTNGAQVLLSDIEMPGEDGYELLARSRQPAAAALHRRRRDGLRPQHRSTPRPGRRLRLAPRQAHRTLGAHRRRRVPGGR